MSASGGYQQDVAPTRTEKPVKERLGYSAALAVIVVLAALVGGAWWYAHRQADGRIPHGTRIAGVDIGGMQRREAIAALRRDLQPRVDTPITLSVQSQSIEVVPSAAGLTVDYAASVDRAVVTDSWDPTTLWNFFTGADDLQPVVNIDQTMLRTEVTKLAQQVGEPGRNAGLRFTDGQVRRIRARDGEGLDVDAVSSALAHAYLSDTGVADVMVTHVAPRVTDAKVQTALDTVVNPALAAPVTLVFSGHPVRLRPTDFQDALTLVPHQGQLQLGVDRAKLMAQVLPAIGTRQAPVDATVALVHDTPTIVPAKRGTSYSADDVARVFLSLLGGRDDADRRGPVPPDVSMARFGTRAARGLHIVKPVSTFTTTFSRKQVDLADLTRQARLISGTVLRPGDIFSFAATAPPAGEDTSQLATTLYNAAFFAGLADIAHTPPQPHVARFPLGREATVIENGPDLRFKDDTSDGVLIQVTVGSGSVTVTLWSRPTWHITSATSCQPAAGSDAYEVVTSRIFTLVGSAEIDHIEKSFTNYDSSLPARVCRTAGRG